MNWEAISALAAVASVGVGAWAIMRTSPKKDPPPDKRTENLSHFERRFPRKDRHGLAAPLEEI